MYRLLIVEDEKWEREGLRDFLDWTGLGIEVVGCACNGVEGRKMAEQYRPDIIVADIMMPKMDGLQMSQSIRAFLPNARIILLSGYDDFQFAKRSFDFHAFAYLLKPIVKKPFEEVIFRVLAELDLEKSRAAEQESLRSLLSNYVRVNRDSLFLGLLEHGTKSEYIRELSSITGLKPEGRKGIAILALFPVCEKEPSPGNPADHLGRGELDSIAGVLREKGILYVFPRPGNQVVLCMDAPAGESELEAELLELKNELKRLGMESIIGVGDIVEDISEAHRSYSQAKEAFESRFLAGYGELLFPSGREEPDRKDREKAEAAFYQADDIMKRIAATVQKGDRKQYALLTEEFLSLLRGNRSMGKLLLGVFFHNVAGNCHDVLMRNSLAETRQYLLGCFDAASRESKGGNGKEEEIAKRVIEIIEGRYAEELDLKLVSEEIHLSPYYIGSIFKKATGKVFRQYLNDYRIQKAEEILLSRKIQVARLGEKVGIRNPSYFCMLFKERFGFSPGDYRDIRKGGREYV